MYLAVEQENKRTLLTKFVHLNLELVLTFASKLESPSDFLILLKSNLRPCTRPKTFRVLCSLLNQFSQISLTFLTSNQNFFRHNLRKIQFLPNYRVFWFPVKEFGYRDISQGRIQGFFLGGGALVSCSTSTPINHIVFFWRIPVVLENRRSSREGGGCAPLHPPPRSAPVSSFANVFHAQRESTQFQLLLFSKL